jgi:5'-methylthioadenosine phosphorylase
MGRLGIAAGSSLLDAEPPEGATRREIATRFGQVALHEAGDHVLLQRHGLDRYLAPHAIDHRANLSALAALGVDRVLAISSVGSLRTEIEVGSFVVVDDFVALGHAITTSDGAVGHRVPGFDPTWRRAVLEAWRAATDAEVSEGGTYWHSPGPRFETPAEITLIREHADVVGMTMGAECTIAAELELPYACVCVVDNLANGVGPAALTLDEFEAGRRTSRDRVRRALSTAVPVLAGEG